jgi:hypothetical protein
MGYFAVCTLAQLPCHYPSMARIVVYAYCDRTLLGASLTYGSHEAGALVAFFAIFVYSTMYKLDVFLMKRKYQVL